MLRRLFGREYANHCAVVETFWVSVYCVALWSVRLSGLGEGVRDCVLAAFSVRHWLDRQASTLHGCFNLDSRALNSITAAGFLRLELDAIIALVVWRCRCGQAPIIFFYFPAWLARMRGCRHLHGVASAGGRKAVLQLFLWLRGFFACSVRRCARVLCWLCEGLRVGVV